MGSVLIRAASLVCVCLMILTTFQVLAVASAETPMYDEPDVVNERLKRLTVSNTAASLPSSIVIDGTIHLAWADGVQGNMTLRWKCSADDGASYSPDMTLTPQFDEIADLSIDGDESSLAIVLVGAYEGVEGTYLVCSPDGGDTWSKVNYLSDGREAAVAVHDGNAFIGLFRSDDGSEAFYVLKGAVGSTMENLTAILALSAPSSKVELLVDDDIIHLALLVDRSVVVGSFDAEGAIIDRPTAVWTAADGSIAGLAIGLGACGAEIWLTYNSDSEASLRRGTVDASGFYSFADVVVEAGRYGEISIAGNERGTMAAWERIDGGSEIVCVLLSDGAVVHGPAVISSGDAASPSVAATDGFDVVFMQDGERPELFAQRDVLFLRPDLERLVSWTARQDPSIFHNARARDALVDSLDDVRHAFSSGNESEVRSLVQHIQGTDALAAHLNLLDLRSDGVRAVIESNLDHRMSTVMPLADGSGPTNGSMHQMSSGVEINDYHIDYLNGNVLGLFWYTYVPSTAEVMYGPTAEYGRVRIGESGMEHLIVVSGLSPSTLYHFNIVSRSLDDPNDVAESGDIEVTTLAIVFTELVVESWGSSAHISWLTNEPTYGFIYYGIDSPFENIIEEEYDPQVPKYFHEVRIYDLDPDVVYSFRLLSSSDTEFAASEVLTFKYDDMTMDNLAVDILGPDSAEITWTSVMYSWYGSDLFILYGTDANYAGGGIEWPQSYYNGGSGQRFSTVLTGLTPDTLYYFTIFQMDHYMGAFIERGTYTFTIRSIDDLSVTVGLSTVHMDWDTSIPSSTEVYYLTEQELDYWSYNDYYCSDILDKYGLSSGGEFGTSHSVTLSNLEPNTVYHFRAVSRSPYDPNDLAAIEGTFVTGGIKDIVVAVGSTVQISWKTNVAATTEVHYGTTTAYGSSITGADGTAHSVTLELPSDTLYHFKIVSRPLSDPDQTFQSDDSTFRTASISVSDIAYNVDSSLTITWTTNLPGTTEVYWGTTAAYGNVVTGTTGTSHSVTIPGLASNITYHFQIVSRSLTNADDVARSSDMTFTTVGMYDLVVMTDASVTQISWKTNVAATTEVHYGTTTAYGSSVQGADGTSHSVSITGLASATTYHFKAISRSLTEDGDVVRSGDTVFVTPGVAISGVQVAYIGFNTVRIEWTSSVNSASTVNYGTTAACGSSVSGESGTAHSVTLTGLSSGTTYYFKVESRSLSNPTDTASSIVGSFTIPSSLDSTIVIQYIGLTSVRITWTTDVVMTTEVVYGTTTAYSYTFYGIGGTDHIVTITGLNPGTTYYFKAISKLPSDPSNIIQSSNKVFTTVACNDADSSEDAGGLGDPTSIVPGAVTGALNSYDDHEDCYLLNVLSGQVIDVVLNMPSGFDYDLYVYGMSWPPSQIISSTRKMLGGGPRACRSNCTVAVACSALRSATIPVPGSVITP